MIKLRVNTITSSLFCVIAIIGCSTSKDVQTKCYKPQVEESDSIKTTSCDVLDWYNPLVRKVRHFGSPDDDTTFLKRKVTRNKITGISTTEIFYRGKVYIRYESKNGKIDGQYTMYYLPKCILVDKEATFLKGKLNGYYNTYHANGDLLVHKLYRNDKLIKDESPAKQ